MNVSSSGLTRLETPGTVSLLVSPVAAPVTSIESVDLRSRTSSLETPQATTLANSNIHIDRFMFPPRLNVDHRLSRRRRLADCTGEATRTGRGEARKSRGLRDRARGHRTPARSGVSRARQVLHR
jgi:hypothetical protein